MPTSTVSEEPRGIGRYQVDCRIGSGGMAVTYRCVLRGPGGFAKQFLIKQLQPAQRHNAVHRQMFLDEAKLCGLLHHAHIPQVFELGEHDGLPFMVMEYVAGPNLVMVARKLRHGATVPYGMVAHLFAGVARALHAAHTLRDRDGRRLQIVHRDVSLANILVSPDGHAKLIDFGIAKSELGESKTEVGTIKGKLRYMAPEQFHEEEVDFRADLYQLGVSMYWLATGQPPFSAGGWVQQIAARLEKKPPSPTEVVDGFPPALAEIIQACLERDPASRPGSADEVARALDSFVTSDPDYHADEASIAQWIRGLFPEEELAVFHSSHPTHTGTVDLHPDTLGSKTDLAPAIAAIPAIPAIVPTPALSEAHTEDHHLGGFSRGGVAALMLVALLSTAVGVALQPRLLQLVAPARLHAAESLLHDTLLDDAEGYLRSREYAVAKALTEKVIHSSRATPETHIRATRINTEVEIGMHLERARRALHSADYAGAVDAVTEVLVLAPNHAEALELRALVDAAERQEEPEPGDEDAATPEPRPHRLYAPAPIRKHRIEVPSSSAAPTPAPGSPTEGGSEEQGVRPTPTRNPRPAKFVPIGN